MGCGDRKDAPFLDTWETDSMKILLIVLMLAAAGVVAKKKMDAQA